jgi:hypothetical protein
MSKENKCINNKKVNCKYLHLKIAFYVYGKCTSKINVRFHNKKKKFLSNSTIFQEY